MKQYETGSAGDQGNKQGESESKVKGIQISASIARKRGMKAVSTTPYAVFVHSSPVYKTCFSPSPRQGRPSRRPPARFRRSLPFRPDAYPYADARWSAHLVGKTRNTVPKPE